MGLSNNQWERFQEFLLNLYQQNRLDGIQKMVMDYLELEIAHHCSMFDYGRAKDGEIIFFHPYSGNLDEAALKDYYKNYQYQDYMVWNFSQTEPFVYRNSDLMPDSMREKSPIYQRWMQPLRVYHGLGCTIVNRHFYGSVTMFRTKEMGDFTWDELYLLKILNTHLASHISMLYPNGVRESDFANMDMDKHWLEKYHLTEREIEIVRQLQEGLTNQEIGSRLCISEVTVKKHMSHIFQKMQVKSRSQLLLKLEK